LEIGVVVIIKEVSDVEKKLERKNRDYIWCYDIFLSVMFIIVYLFSFVLLFLIFRLIGAIFSDYLVIILLLYNIPLSLVFFIGYLSGIEYLMEMEEREKLKEEKLKRSQRIKSEGRVRISMINNHPAIIHEMVHVRIHKRFGFKKWRIIRDGKGLLCVTTLPKSILFPKYFPKIFLWEIFHLVHDSFIPFLWMDIITITVKLREFILINRKIIKEILKESE